jgi:hypothetical protein
MIAKIVVIGSALIALAAVFIYPTRTPIECATIASTPNFKLFGANCN